MRYGRITEEDNTILNFYLETFGDRVLHHTILVFTNVNGSTDKQNLECEMSELKHATELSLPKKIFMLFGFKYCTIDNCGKDWELFDSTKEIIDKVISLSQNGEHYFQSPFSAQVQKLVFLRSREKEVEFLMKEVEVCKEVLHDLAISPDFSESVDDLEGRLKAITHKARTNDRKWTESYGAIFQDSSISKETETSILEDVSWRDDTRKTIKIVQEKESLLRPDSAIHKKFKKLETLQKSYQEECANIRKELMKRASKDSNWFQEFLGLKLKLLFLKMIYNLRLF